MSLQLNLFRRGFVFDILIRPVDFAVNVRILRSLMVLQHEACEHLGILAGLFRQHGFTYRYFKMFEGESPLSLTGYTGLIILGGPMNVYQEEEHPFLKVEDVLIKQALKDGVPILGICLGAQLIAKAAGAKVHPGGCKEIGWYKVGLTDEGLKDRLFRGFEEEFTVFQWHGDTFDIPQGGVRLVWSELFPNQALCVGGGAYGLQFHLEVTRSMILEWTKRYEDELASLRGSVDPEEMVKAADRHIGQLNRYTSLLCSNFIKLLR